MGNISKHVKSFELEDEFRRYGDCDIKRHGSYAFIEYNSEKDAEAAIQGLNGFNMKGLDIGIEWSKRSNRYDPRETRRPPRRENDAKCYNCNKIGHFARDCRSRRRSRSRSNDRYRGRRDSRSYSPRDRRYDDRRRDRSPRRRYRSPRGRDGSYERRDDRDRDRRRDSRDRFERRDRDRGEGRDRDGWEAENGDRRRSASRGSRTPPADRRRSPVQDQEDRKRSGSKDSGKYSDPWNSSNRVGHRERRRDDDEPRPKSPADRPQNDEREVGGDKANDNPERQDGGERDDAPAQEQKE